MGVAGMLTFAAHPTEDIIAVADTDGSITAFSVTSDEEVWRTTVARAGMFGALEFTPDGKVLNGSFGSGIAQQWNASDGSKVGVDHNVEATLTGGAVSHFSRDGKWFHVQTVQKGLTRSTVKDVQTGRVVAADLEGSALASHASARRVVMMRSAVELTAASYVGLFSRKGKDKNGGSQPSVTPAHDEFLIQLVDVDSRRVVGSWSGLDARFSADGTRLIVTGLHEPNWLLIDANSGASLLEAPPSTPLSPGWALSLDARHLATIQSDQLVMAELSNPVEYKIVSAATTPLITMEKAVAAPTAGLDEKSAAVMTRASARSAAAFTPDGRWLVARALDSKIDVWDLVTGNRMPFRLPAVESPSGPLSVRTHPAADRSAGQTWQPVEVTSNLTELERMQRGNYDYKQGYECRALSGSSPEEWLKFGIDLSYPGCSVSPDGKRLVVAGVERSQIGKQTKLSTPAACRFFGRCSSPLVVFDVAERRTVARLRNGQSPNDEKMSFRANELQWSPDGRFLTKRVVDYGKTMPSVSQILGEVGSSAIGRPSTPAKTLDLNNVRLSSRLWAAETGDELDLAQMGLVSSYVVGFVPDSARMLTASRLVMGQSARDLEIWDLQSRSRVGRFPNVPVDSTGDQDIVSNGKALMGPDNNGSLWIRSMSTGELLGLLRVLENGEWLVTTPSGLFDGSPAGWRGLSWRADTQIEIGNGELFFNEFYQPGLLADLLAGRTPRLARSIQDRDRRQPVVALTAAATDDRTTLLRIKLSEAPAQGEFKTGSGARDLRLFRNGVLVKAWRGDIQLNTSGEVELEARVPLIAGENRIVAYAFNRDNIKSTDATLNVTSKSDRRDGTTYVLAVGINRYSNEAFNLLYAAQDATAFGTEFARQQQALGVAHVEVVRLLDSEATRANILFALGRLSGAHEGQVPDGMPIELARLRRAEPEDTVVVYFAGHGAAYDGRFHLIPSDLKYTGTRADAGASISQLLEQSISDTDLERAFDPIDGRHLLLIIDACNSGQAIQSADDRFGPMNSRGLAQLAYEKGMFVLAASQAYQAAVESSRLEHGYMTFALVEEGLKTRVADTTPRDGDVKVGEWFDFAVQRVPQLQLEALDVAPEDGRVLTLGSKGSLQTPRVFARRDDSNPELVVARPK
jgi:WD40 repeat protein